MTECGAGPGDVAPDGSPVGLYLELEHEGEPELIHNALDPGATVLELGSGTGRITHPLLALGHPVVAVDESPAMLAHISGAETVCARIQDLALGRRFAGVVLGSHFVNLPDPDERSAILRVCRAHLGSGGRVLVEQMPTSSFDGGLESGAAREHNRARIEAHDVVLSDTDTVTATMRYIVGDRHWTQTVRSVRFDTGELTAAGLRMERALTEDGRWFAAVHRG